MTRARQIADILDANGDVVSSMLDNVPPSNDASALTTGTLDAARIAAGSLATSKISGLHAVATSGSYADVTGTPNLHAVATSGDYNGLSNRPSIFNGNYDSLSNKPTNSYRLGTFHHASTSGNRGLSGTYVNHLSTGSYTVPSGFQAVCIMSVHFSSMYETNAGGGECRFHVQGPNNWYSPVHRFGRGSFNNYASAESFTYFQHGFHAGTHTVHAQAKTWQGGVTLNEDGGYDNLTCTWILTKT